MQAATADYVPRASWVVMTTYDEEEAEARSARLAGADVRESSAPEQPASPRSQLLRMISTEALVVGEATVMAFAKLLPARRGKPNTLFFTTTNAVVLVLLFFWCECC